MKENLQIALVTVLIFTAGLMVGVWTQRTRPLPPPPFGPMAEFRLPGPDFRYGPPLFLWQTGASHGPPDPEEMRRRMGILMPRVEAFRAQVEKIEGDFRNSLAAILTPDQLRKLEAFRQRPVYFPGPPGPVRPLDRPTGAPTQPSGWNADPMFVSIVIYRPLLERLSTALGLNDRQRQQLRELLLARRTKLITLVDETPPPSLQLGYVVGGPPGPPPWVAPT
jgi:hypothetical protein